MDNDDLRAIAELRTWPSDVEAWRGVVAVTYRNLGDGVPLWREVGQFERSEAAAINAILDGGDSTM